MTSELLFSVDLKVALAVIYHYFIIHRLAGKVLAIRVDSGCRDRLHIGLAYVFSNHRDAELPHVDLFVVCSRDKPSASLDEVDGVD